MLRRAVQTLGEKNWRNIAEQVPGRDHVQCLQRWKKVLKPGLMKGTWRADEDTQLGGSELASARYPTGLTTSLASPNLRTNLSEPRRLRITSPIPSLVHLVCQGFKNWGQLAARMTGRTSKQCRERWTHHIDPSVYKGEWTAEEDTTIIEVQAQVRFGSGRQSVKILIKNQDCNTDTDVDADAQPNQAKNSNQTEPN